MASEDRAGIGHLALFLTENCNLRCDYCFASNMIKRNISLADGKKAVDFLFDQCGDRKTLGITFWGGEPFMRFSLMKKLVKFAEDKAEAAGKNIVFSIPTNATLLTEEKLDYVNEHELRLSLSIDGMAETQARRPTVSGNNSFPMIERALPRVVDKLKRHLPPVRMTLIPATVHNLRRDVLFFINAGIRNVNFFSAPEDDWDGAAMKIFLDQQMALAEDFIGWIREGNLSIQFGSWSTVLSRIYSADRHPEKTKQGRGKEDDRMRHCGMGDRMIAVSVDGEFFPCHRFVFYDRDKRQHVLGTLDQGLRTDTLAPFRTMKVGDPEAGGIRCVDCEIAYACKTFCGAVNYDYSGCLTSIPANVCKITKATYQACRHVVSTLGEDPHFKQYISRINQPGARAKAFVIPDPHTDAYDELLDDLAGKAEDLLRGLGL
jgi:uncharacterized protein